MKFTDGVHDITNEQYHAASGVSRSRLMLLDKSPYHFWYEVMSGEAEGFKATPSKNMGSAFHTLLLEENLFHKEFCVKPKAEKLPPEVRMKDVGKEQYEQVKAARKIVQDRNKILMEEFEQNAIDKIILSQSDFDQVVGMVNLVKRHEIVTTLLDEAKFELSIFWTDKETGLQFKARPDIWSPKMVVDLKTTKDSNVYKMQRAALEYGYYLQAGMMYEACKAIEQPFEMFVILAAEKEAPYVPSVFMMTDEALQFGIDQFCKYKILLAECINKNKWPGYPVQELTVPQYALNNLNSEE